MKKLIKRAAALILCAAMMGTASYAAAGYSDVPEGAWYARGVEYCTEAGLMNGTGGGQFSPDRTVTRAMLATVLYRQSGSPHPVQDETFRDVEHNAWHYQPILWATRQGHMVGYGSGWFGPEDPITHEQLAVTLWRYAGCPTGSGTVPPGTADYAASAMRWAGSSGLLQGLDDFTPNLPATRAQLAAVLTNFASPAVLTTVSAMDVMCQPCGIAAMADGSLLVTDTYNKVVWQVANGKSVIYAGGSTVEDLYGQPIGGYNDDALKNSYFKQPWAIAPFLDGWAVSDAANNAVRLIRAKNTQTVNGHTSENLTVTDLGVAFQRPTGLASDPSGNLYVSDTLQDAVRKITPSGEVTTVVRSVSEPMGLCWHDGALYIAESGANRIVKYQNARLTTVAGSGQPGLADGPAAQASFSAPQGVTAGADGTLYISDTGNSAIRQLRGGQVTTLTVRDAADLTSFFPVSPSNLLVQGNVLYICDPFSRKLLALPLR